MDTLQIILVSSIGAIILYESLKAIVKLVLDERKNLLDNINQLDNQQRKDYWKLENRITTLEDTVWKLEKDKK